MFQKSPSDEIKDKVLLGLPSNWTMTFLRVLTVKVISVKRYPSVVVRLVWVLLVCIVDIGDPIRYFNRRSITSVQRWRPPSSVNQRGTTPTGRPSTVSDQRQWRKWLVWKRRVEGSYRPHRDDRGNGVSVVERYFDGDLWNTSRNERL